MTEVMEDKIAASETAKSLGNEYFNAKNFDEAIKHYTDAIRLNPENAVFYSNRSVCYASKKDWRAALEDALICVSKDSAFQKGYMRLATAQIELQMFDDAEAALEKAASLQSENDQISKLRKLIATKKAVGLSIVNKPTTQLDASQRKEYFELYEQGEAYKKDLRTLNTRIAVGNRDLKVNQATLTHVSSLGDNVPLYRSVGKSFILNDKASIEKRLEDNHTINIKSLRDSLDRKEYIERRLNSATTNLKAMTTAVM